jgi:DNA-binding MarR family transcriptional regulator
MDHVDKIKAQWNAERPDLDVGPMVTIGRLARLVRHLAQAHEEVFTRHGLNAATFDVLATLRRSGPPYALTPKGLLSATMVTSGTMTNRLDRLETAGFIQRAPDPEDGRGVVIRLTDAGRATIDAAVSDHVANQHALLAPLDAEERAALDALLKTWLAGVEASA